MKRRLLLGLAPIFVLILAISIYAISLFTKLGISVDVILRENFRSVLAGQQMKEAAQRMDSALFFSLIGEEDHNRRLYQQNFPIFQEGLKTEINNITLPDERELTQTLVRLQEKSTAGAQAFWNTDDLAVRRKLYFEEMLPNFTKIKNTAQKIVNINQDNMVKADRNARELSARSIRYMGITSVFGIAIVIFFCLRLQRAILRPIQMLTSVSKELGDGKLDQVVPVQSKDELGQLADAFNKMATKLRAYHQIINDQIFQARQMTEITFSAFPDPIIMFSPENIINFTNPAAALLFQKLGSAAKLPLQVQEQVEHVLQGGHDYLPTGFEKTAVVKIDEKETFLLPRVIGVRDENGNIFGAALILQDVTRLRLLDELKNNLVSTVSHELKTPLSSVRMGLYLLLEERIGTLNPKQTELLLAAREDAERLLNMINNLLDLTQLESGKMFLNLERIPSEKLIQTVFKDFHVFVESRGSKLLTAVEPKLPSVRVDLGQISHVFSNLISNAVKHTKHGEQITVVARREQGKIRFSVIDQGEGIPPQFQSQIFERFFRIPGTESVGTGLGLAIAREIVTAHGGIIGAASTPGEGAEFYFELPAVQTEIE